MFGQENQRAASAGSRNGVQTLTTTIAASTATPSGSAAREHPLLQRPLRLHDQEARAEQRVADDERERR